VVDANIAQLLAAGVTLSLDDFGAGYSTLILLSQLAIAEVKIEQALIVADIHAQRAQVLFLRQGLGALGHDDRAAAVRDFDDEAHDRL